MSLPLVDVNSETAATSWPLLTSAISSADFIALDLELSGLGWSKTKSALDAPERYKLQCEVAASYGVLSMGVACFQWQPSSSGSGLKRMCKVEAFNVWLLSQHSYTIDPSSAKFLTDHGFDFNKQFCCGLRYTPAHTSTELKLREDGFHLPSLFALILSSGCPIVLHNGLIDLMFLYSHFYAPLPSRLDNFMANLNEMWRGGVYDTKAITELLLHEKASYLEYIFRKRQSCDLKAAGSEDRHYLELVFANYAAAVGECCVEPVSLLPPPLPPLEQLFKTQLCQTFSSYGYCHRRDCGRSHDVLIVLALEEHKSELAKAKRKRRKGNTAEVKVQRKRQRTTSSDKETVEGEEISELEAEGGETSELSKLFEYELSAAKAKFSDGGSHQPPCGQDSVNMKLKLKPSFGHRAGFDAFMTGYSFASVSVDHGTVVASEHERKSHPLSGLEEMKNKLANRGKAFPLQVIKSHFATTSQHHRSAQAVIEAFFKQHATL